MSDPAVFQVAIGVAGLGFVLLFADSLDTENPDRTKVKILGALVFYTLSLFSVLIPATTRQTYNLFGLIVPPLYVWWEGLTLGFLLSVAWDIFYKS